MILKCASPKPPFRGAAHSSRSGQALVEALVVMFVLTPLFLLLPMIGKIGEIKSDTIEAARYAAWERTVYFNHTNHGPATQLSVASKDNDTIAKEAYVRIFSGPDAEISHLDGSTGTIDPNNVNYITKGYTGNGDPLLTPYNPTGGSSTTSDSAAPGFIDGILMTVIDFVGGTSNNCGGGNNNQKPGAWASILKYLTGGDFFLSTCGYVQSNIQVTTNVASAKALAPFDTLKLTFNQSHFVMSDSWNAAGPKHIRDQVAPFTLTSFLDAKGSFMSYISGAITDILSFLWPEFGGVQPDFDYANDPNYKSFLATCQQYYGYPKDYCNQMLYFGKIDTEAVPSDRLN